MWILAGLGAATLPLLSGLLAREAEGWVELTPKGLLRLARLRLPAELRDELYEEWSAELHAAVHAAETRPISRLVLGLRFATGLLWSARSVATELGAARAKGEQNGGQPLSPVADFAAGITASGGRIEILMDATADGATWLLPATPGALGPDAIFMVDGEGHFYGVAFPDRTGGSLRPVLRNGQIYLAARVEFSDPNDPARPPLENFVRRIRKPSSDAGWNNG